MDIGDIKYLTPTKVLKLSEALKIGLQRHPQAIYNLYYKGATCALGAIAVGRGWQADTDDSSVYELYLSDVDNTPLWSEIGDLNDAGVSREDIAIWLESIGQ